MSARGGDVRTPPHSIEAEQAVLGGLLLDARAWDDVADMLSDVDFYRPDHRLIFEAIGQVAAGGKRPAAMAQTEWAEYRDRWQPQLQLQLGSLASKAGDPEEARSRFEKVTQLSPKDAYGWYLLGKTYFAEYEKLNAASKALELTVFRPLDFEVVSGPSGSPTLELRGDAARRAEELGVSLSCSLTHARTMAGAAVVAS